MILVWKICMKQEINSLKKESKINWWVESTTLNYTERFLVLASTITGCISISFFASLLGIPIEITSSAIGLRLCSITSGIKKYLSIIKKQKKKREKIVLLAKSKVNNLEVLISKALIDSNISQDEFF